MERVLVSGANGFIGSHLVDELIKKYEVYGFDNHFPGFGNKILPQEVHQINGDIRNFDDINFATKNMDYVIHLAAISHVGQCLNDAKLCMDVNVGGTINLLEACKNNKIKRVIVAASDHIYGGNVIGSVKETQPLLALYESDIYGMSKAIQARLSMMYFKQYSLPIVVTASGNVYSERQSKPNVIPNFIDAIKNNRHLMIHGNGLQTRDFYHVSDLVNGYIKCLETPKIDGELFNFGSGVGTNIKTIAEIMLNFAPSRLFNINTPRKSHIKYINAGKLNAMNHMVLDTTKAKQILNWEPKISLEDGLKMTMEKSL